MNLFTIIDDSVAIIRLKNGVFKQVPVYHRGERVFVPHGGGFIRICAHFGDSWGTSCPGVKVTEIQALGVNITSSEPRFTQPLKKAA